MLAHKGLKLKLLPFSSLTQKLLSTTVGDDVKPFSRMPSPKGKLPVLGHTYEMSKKSNVIPSVMFDEFFKDLGSIFKIEVLGGTPLVLTCDPSAAEHICRNEGKYPSRGIEDRFEWFYESLRNEESDMAFASGEKWRKLRSMHGKQQTPANVYGYCPGFEAAAERFVRNVNLQKDQDGYIDDLRQLITYWAFEASASFSLGADFDIVKGEGATVADAEALRQALQLFISSIDDFIMGPFFRLKYFPSKVINNLNEGLETLLGVATKYSAAYMDEIKKSGNTEIAHGQPLLQQWLIEGKLTEQAAVRSAASMMAAGVDTTVLTTAFLLQEISQSSEVQDKLHKQIDSVFGKEDAIDMAKLQKLTYLNNAVKESQRLNPVATAFQRHLDNETKLMGYHIPAKTTIMYSLYTAGRSEEVYKDPMKFDPDRWDRDDIHPFALLPFGFGPRGCWGRRFSEIEMKVLITEIMRRFTLKLDSPITHSEKTLLRPGGPVRIKFAPR